MLENRDPSIADIFTIDTFRAVKSWISDQLAKHESVITPA